MSDNKFIDDKENDYVEYFVYPPDCDSLASLNKMIQLVFDECKKISDNYIWHNDVFNIKLLHGIEMKDDELFLYGRINYGENIEDEWFVVHILLELTKRITGLVARVKDSDGEFLLIEAANHLPRWVSPNTAEDRVFLCSGHIHIIREAHVDSDGDSDDCDFDKTDSAPIARPPITKEMLDIVRSGEGSMEDTATEKVILERIGNYPEKLPTLFQYAHLYIPVSIAALLQADPSLITPAVRAFCDRDLLDIRACRAMKYFPPEIRVNACVKFTKCSYAMLLKTNYTPEKRTGWNLPLTTDPDYKSHLLGVKLACGFEILLSQSKKHTPQQEITYDKKWAQFKNCLTKMNYFQGFLEHSKEYDLLLHNAQDFYRNNYETTMEELQHSNRLANLLAKIEFDVEKLKAIGDADVALLKTEGCDDDSWVDVSMEELDQILTSRLATGSNPECSQRLRQFINHKSGLEGVEFPSNHSAEPKRPLRGLKTKKKNVKFSPDTKEYPTSSTAKVQFDPDGFMKAVDKILSFSIPEDNYWESDGSGMSSYEDESDSELSSKKTKDTKIVSYMEQMDQELAGTTMAQSFLTKDNSQKKKDGGDTEEFEDIENFKPVDIDKNALKNLLMSYEAQMGAAGPAENLLAPLLADVEKIELDVD